MLDIIWFIFHIDDHYMFFVAKDALPWGYGQLCCWYYPWQCHPMPRFQPLCTISPFCVAVFSHPSRFAVDVIDLFWSRIQVFTNIHFCELSLSLKWPDRLQIFSLRLLCWSALIIFKNLGLQVLFIFSYSFCVFPGFSSINFLFFCDQFCYFTFVIFRTFLTVNEYK